MMQNYRMTLKKNSILAFIIDNLLLAAMKIIYFQLMIMATSEILMGYNIDYHTLNKSIDYCHSVDEAQINNFFQDKEFNLFSH